MSRNIPAGRQMQKENNFFADRVFHIADTGLDIGKCWSLQRAAVRKSVKQADGK